MTSNKYYDKVQRHIGWYIINNNFDYKKLKETIIYFLETTKNYIPNNNLSILYSNLNTFKVLPVSIIENNNYSIPDYIVAAYIIENNCLILRDNFEEAVDHELLHIASSYFDNKKGIISSGFSIVYPPKTPNSKYFSLGTGITEGYTQYLTKKYFGNKKIIDSYTCETQIAENLKTILSEELMNSYYFNANLIGLIKELKKYNTLENIYIFIKAVDILNNNVIQKVNPNEIVNCLNIANKFLIDTYINKEELIVKKQKKEKYHEFVIFTTNLPCAININNKKYQLTKIETIIKKKLNF